MEEAEAEVDTIETALALAIADKLKVQHAAALLQQQLNNMTRAAGDGEKMAVECSRLLHEVGAEVSFALILVCVVGVVVATNLICGASNLGIIGRT